MRRSRSSRRGTTTVEVAIVGSATFLLLIGLLVGSMGVFRYQELARLARDAARWASVHGAQYASDNKVTAPAASDIYAQVIAPNLTLLNASSLTYSITWNTSNSATRTVTNNGVSTTLANTVSVTLTYNWIPEALFGGTTMSSTSVYVMSY